MLTETELLYAAIATHHNEKIIKDALNVLKQFSEDGFIYLYDDDNRKAFKITKDTKVCVHQNI